MPRSRFAGWRGGNIFATEGTDENQQQFVVNNQIKGIITIQSNEAADLAYYLNRLMIGGVTGVDGMSPDDVLFENSDFVKKIVSVMNSGDVKVIVS